MEPFVLFPLVTFMAIEGCCFACAYNNIFRRLRAVEERLSSIEASRISSTTTPVIVRPSTQPSAPPPLQTRYPLQAPQMYYYPPQQAYQAPLAPSGDDPLPVTYAYYQTQK